MKNFQKILLGFIWTWRIIPNNSEKLQIYTERDWIACVDF